MQASTAGKGRKGKQTAGDFTEYPTRQVVPVGGLEGHLRFGKASGQIREPLAWRCLTPNDRCTFAWENPTGRECRQRDKGKMIQWNKMAGKMYDIKVRETVYAFGNNSPNMQLIRIEKVILH